MDQSERSSVYTDSSLLRGAALELSCEERGRSKMLVVDQPTILAHHSSLY